MNNKIISLAIQFIAVILFLNSCVKSPDDEKKSQIINSNGKFVLVLCEGLMGQNNSTVSRIDLETGTIINDFFGAANLNFKLGDTGNGLAFYGDTAYAAITGSKSIVAFRISDGKYIGSINFSENETPRKIVIVNDTLAFATLLYKNSYIRFNPKTLKLIGGDNYSGAAPEGITFLAGKIFIANSGFGDYMQTADKASTISVIDAFSNSEISYFKTGLNPIELIANKANNRVYLAYYNLSSKPDSLGGIVEYDALSLNKIREIRCSPRSIKLSQSGDSIIWIAKDGLHLWDLKNSNQELILQNPNSNHNWYSCEFSYYDNSILIGDALDYQSDGSIIEIDKSSLAVKKIYNAKINPGTILQIK